MAGLSYPVTADISGLTSAMQRAKDIVAAQSAQMAQKFLGAADAANKIGTRMADAQQIVGRVANDMVGRFNAIGEGADKAARFAGAVPGALLAIGGAVAVWNLVEHAIAAAQERLEAVLKVARGAEAGGVGTSFFQRWIGEAQTLGLEVSKLQGILENARKATEVRIGEGDKGLSSAAGDRLRQHALAGNIGKGDLGAFETAANQEAKLRIVLDLIDQLRAKSADAAAFDIAGKVFGSDFETKMRSGIDIVGQMRTALDSLSPTGSDGRRILAPDEVAAAEKLKKTLDETSKIMGDALAPIQRDLALYQAQQAQASAELSQNLASAAANALGLYGHLKSVGGMIEQIGQSSFWTKVQNAADKLGLVSYKGLELVDPTTGKSPYQGTAGAGASASGVGRINIQEATPDTSRSLPALGGSKRGTAEPTESIDQIERYIQQMQKANDLAKAELSVVGATNVERDKALALARATAAAREAGRDLTEKERADILALASANAELNGKLADQRQRLAENADMMRTFGQMGADAFAGMILEGRGLNETLQTLSKSLARMLIQAALTGQGPLAGLLGMSAPASGGPNAVGGLVGLATSLIPKFANGTDYAPGGVALVGERGPELVNLSRGAQVIPNHELPNFVQPPTSVPVGMGGRGISVKAGDIHVTVSGNGVTAGEVTAIVRRAQSEQARALPSLIREAVGRGQVR